MFSVFGSFHKLKLSGNLSLHRDDGTYFEDREVRTSKQAEEANYDMHNQLYEIKKG